MPPKSGSGGASALGRRGDAAGAADSDIASSGGVAAAGRPGSSQRTAFARNLATLLHSDAAVWLSSQSEIPRRDRSASKTAAVLAPAASAWFALRTRITQTPPAKTAQSRTAKRAPLA